MLQLESGQADNAVDAVWSIGTDGRWRRSRDFAMILHRKRKHVVEALELLVNYGFAESIDRGERLFRTIAKSPSPMEVAKLLASLRPSVRQAVAAHRGFCLVLEKGSTTSF